jgi:hypothetical protein
MVIFPYSVSFALSEICAGCGWGELPKQASNRLKDNFVTYFTKNAGKVPFSVLRICFGNSFALGQNDQGIGPSSHQCPCHCEFLYLL